MYYRFKMFWFLTLVLLFTSLDSLFAQDMFEFFDGKENILEPMELSFEIYETQSNDKYFVQPVLDLKNSFNHYSYETTIAPIENNLSYQYCHTVNSYAPREVTQTCDQEEQSRGIKRKHPEMTNEDISSISTANHPQNHVDPMTIDKNVGQHFCKVKKCESSFQNREHLFNHINYIHVAVATSSKEHELLCHWEDCKASFRFKNRLRDHMAKVHAGYAHRKCPHCSHREFWSSTLKSHKKKFHPEEVEHENNSQIKKYVFKYVDFIAPNNLENQPSINFDPIKQKKVNQNMLDNYLNFSLKKTSRPIVDATIACIVLNVGIKEIEGKQYEFILTSYKNFELCIHRINGQKNKSSNNNKRKNNILRFFQKIGDQRKKIVTLLKLKTENEEIFDQQRASVEKELKEASIAPFLNQYSPEILSLVKKAIEKSLTENQGTEKTMDNPQVCEIIDLDNFAKKIIETLKNLEPSINIKSIKADIICDFFDFKKHPSKTNVVTATLRSAK